MSVIAWIKKNRLATVLLVLVTYFVCKNFFGNFPRPLSISPSRYKSSGEMSMGAPVMEMGKGIALPSFGTSGRDYAPQPEVENRLVIQESHLSLLVKDVVEVRNKILEHTDSNGGYMVNASTSNPQDAPTATITIRIPSDKLQVTLDYFHSLSVKVVSENLVGRDITDQYVDIDKQIATYEETKAKYESILDQATKISDITSLTQQIIYTQNQIDSLKGQQNALEKKTQMAKLTIYLSTDEIALPYAPSETFRPNVIFKLAVRSLVGFARKLATTVIWAGVYATVWLPALIIFIFARKWLAKQKTQV